MQRDTEMYIQINLKTLQTAPMEFLGFVMHVDKVGEVGCVYWEKAGLIAYIDETDSGPLLMLYYPKREDE